MKKLLAFSTIAVITTVICIGCKKDNNAVAKSKTQLLTEKTWKLVKLEQRINTADPWSDITAANYMPCELDDIFTFTSAGVFTETEGATKCSPSDPDLVDSGNWSFQSNETILRFAGGGSTEDATIETLDASTLKFSFSDPSVPNYLRITMQH